MTGDEALQEARRILRRDAVMLERHVGRTPQKFRDNPELMEHRILAMLKHSAHLNEVANALPISTLGGTSVELSVDQARMLMNYISRASVLDSQMVEASVSFDGDEPGALDALLKNIVAKCREIWLESMLQATKEQRCTTPMTTWRYCW